jgi:hypothetical protein
MGMSQKQTIGQAILEILFGDSSHDISSKQYCGQNPSSKIRMRTSSDFVKWKRVLVRAFMHWNSNAKSPKRPTQTAFGSGVRPNGTTGN